MNTAARVGAFTAGLGLAFGAAFALGQAVGPVGDDPAPVHDTHDGTDTHDHADTHDGDTHDRTGGPLTPDADERVGAPRADGHTH